MSYHIGPSPVPRATLAPAVQPHHYPIVPLSQVPSSALAPAGLSAEAKRVLVIIGLVIVALILISIFSGPPKPVRRNAPVKRLSTPELAKNLYERLERRGGANESTLRSLKAYASKR